MANKMFANRFGSAHQGSNKQIAAFPDVCKTPSPGGPTAIPYPHIEALDKAANEAKKVKVQAKSTSSTKTRFSSSVGNQPGALKGVISSKNVAKTRFNAYSPKVKMQGKSVSRLTGIPWHNTPNVDSDAEAALGELEQTLTQHKVLISNPQKFNAASAQRAQDQFEQKVEALIQQLLSSAAGNPTLQLAVNNLVRAVRAAAKGA
jgi:hypothetical protein